MSVIKRVGPKYRDILLLVFVCVCVRLHLACSVWKIKIDCFFFTYSRHHVKLLSWSLLIHLRHYYVYKWTFIVILNTVISDNFVFLDGRIRFFFLHESFCPELSRIVWLIDRCGCVSVWPCAWRFTKDRLYERTRSWMSISSGVLVLFLFSFVSVPIAI